MNITRKLSTFFQNLHRYSTSISQKLPAVKVCSLEDKDDVKVQFRYLKSSKTIVEPKNDSVQNLLSRIKSIAKLEQKKEEVRREFLTKHSQGSQVAFQEIDDELSVRLIHNNNLVDETLSNREAWAQASLLKIGDTVYEIKFNQPTVIGLNLPNYILENCSLRPKFLLELANLEDCQFTWYRSLSKQNALQLMNTNKCADILIDKEKYWLKVHEGFIYTTCSKDIGCFLKLVCIPKCGDYVGDSYTTESPAPVEKFPNKVPFEERQIYTKSFTDNNSIRCLSYNTLANSYVDKKKFPYCSDKTRDSYYRKQLLFKELKGYNSDILCLQEIEDRAFYYDFTPILKAEGYKGIYKKKGGRRYEGLATFFRSKKFKLLQSYGVLLNDIIRQDISNKLRNQIGTNNKDVGVLLNQESAIQISLLQDNNHPERKLFVANTHLYSNKDSPEVRLIQAAICTNYIEHIIKEQKLESSAVLFCGDFNSLPVSDAYDFIISGKCSPKWRNGSNCDGDSTLVHYLNLGNACGTPKYTNYTEQFHGCLDYIFYSKNHLTVSEIVPMPRHEDVISEIGLPNEVFPSDHIAIVCTLKWNV